MNLSEKLNALFLPSPSPPPISADSVCSNEADTINATAGCSESIHSAEIDADPSSGNAVHYKRRSSSPISNIDIRSTKRNPHELVKSAQSLQKHSNQKRIESNSEIPISVKHRDSVVTDCTSATVRDRVTTVSSANIKHPTVYLSNIISPELLQQQHQHYVMRTAAGTSGFGGSALEEDEVDKKFKLHQISRKRKFPGAHSHGINGFNAMESAVDQAPPAKRHRAHGGVSKGKGKGRKRGKSKGKRGRGGKGRNKYPNVRRRNTTNSDNYSTDVFEDEEDDGSDIDLNAMNSTNSQSLNQRATTSTNSSHRR